MEVNLNSPGHYVVETRGGLDVVTQPHESVRCQLMSIPSLLAGRNITPRHSLCMINQDGSVNVTLNRVPSTESFCTEIIGHMAVSKAIKDMRINGSGWASADLAKVIRFNPQYFSSPDVAATTAKALLALHSKRVIERKEDQDQRGNKSAMRNVVTTSSLPEYVSMHLPIFDSEPSIAIQVAVELNPDDDLVYLVRTDLNSLIAKEVEKVHGAIIVACDTYGIPVIHA